MYFPFLELQKWCKRSAEIRRRNCAVLPKVILCYIDGNEAARNMYEKLGFTLTGDRDEDEIIMEKAL